MDALSLETLIYVVGVVLTVGAVAGLGWIAATELRLRSVRRVRLAGGGSGPNIAEKPSGGSVLSGQVLSTVRRLGQQSAVRDPAKLSLLRSRLMQAGFYNREAPVIFLGVKAAA